MSEVFRPFANGIKAIWTARGRTPGVGSLTLPMAASCTAPSARGPGPAGPTDITAYGGRRACMAQSRRA